MGSQRFLMCLADSSSGEWRMANLELESGEADEAEEGIEGVFWG
jgi:hypothetical protein